MRRSKLTTKYKKLLDHYVSFWGKPTDAFEFKIEEAPTESTVYVVEFEPKIYDQTWIYATVGISWNSMKGPEVEQGNSGERIEMFIYSGERNPELVNTLISLASYPFINDTFFGIGHTIPGTAQGIVEGSPLTDILFAPALNEEAGLRFFHLNKKIHTDILWVVPIYPSEGLFNTKYGPKELTYKFIEEEMDTVDFFRTPVI